ncbi:putative protein kinase RLK-Pelle-LRR-I-1 family [Helianthus annuus]|nr:putative protein kinase RLK-Pelle-LRR-I-1 family [Helianthus annuus]KAJ0690847.1 putative protein kinase RLK-Pelle-LRR-I-1 family [Helianthus annuus]KAJ0872506.1 putative protein kinase RLK-Pelle-LRR-I-1 family [Helianthus annuus]
MRFATEDFRDGYYMWSDGHSDVYAADIEHFDSFAMKGKMTSELPRRRSTVVIKRLRPEYCRKGKDKFFEKIETLSRCMHPNIVSLLGFCNEHPHMIFVFEYASNGSLEGNLDKLTNLTWVQRIKICIDIARGLDYLHTPVGVKQRLIHGDLSSAHILLGKNFEAKIADSTYNNFDLLDQMTSELYAETNVYMDPEYEKTRKMETASDVYSFGVILFDLLVFLVAVDLEVCLQETHRFLEWWLQTSEMT